MSSIQFSDFKMFTCSVQPVDLSSNPINTNSFQSMSFMSNDIFFFRSIDKDSVDCLVSNISIIDSIFSQIKVKSDNIFQVHFDQSIMTSICTHVSQVISVAEDDPWLSFVSSFTDVSIQFSFVVCFITFTVIRTRGIVTVLTALSFDLRTFVDVFTGLLILHQPVSFVAFTVISG